MVFGERNQAGPQPADQAELARAKIEELVGELEAALEAPEVKATDIWALRARVLKLQAALHLASEPEPPERLSLVGIGSGLLRFAEVVAIPIVVVVLGAFLKDSYEGHLEVQRLELAEERQTFDMVQALDARFSELHAPNIDYDEADVAAARIARFGPVALAPMVAELGYLTSAREPRAEALKKALTLMAANAEWHEELCAILQAATAPGTVSSLGEAGLAIAEDVKEAVACGT